MSTHDLAVTNSKEHENRKPLYRLQQYLVELRVCISLLRELLLEVKELVVVVALIVFFIWGVVQLFQRLHG